MAKSLVSLVTGGASGLGKATVERLVKDGGKVILCDMKNSKAEDVVEKLGDNVKFIPTDVTVENDVINAVKAVKDTFGKLDVIVNCAGVSVAFKVYNFNKERPQKLEDFLRIMMVNCVGTFNVIRLAVGLMGKNPPDENGQRGVVINTSSFAAFEASSGQVAQAASMGAVASMTLPLARDLSVQGIRCCAIAPGLFDTPMTSFLPEKVVRYLARSTPFPDRLGKPEEFAQLVVSIIENPFLNGTNIRLDGGFRSL